MVASKLWTIVYIQMCFCVWEGDIDRETIVCRVCIILDACFSLLVFIIFLHVLNTYAYVYTYDPFYVDHSASILRPKAYKWFHNTSGIQHKDREWRLNSKKETE